jgi:hypothetical protein
VALALTSGLAHAATQGEASPLDAVLAEVVTQHKGDAKKLEALVAKVDKAVRKALATTPYPGSTPDAPRTLDSHPYLALVADLTAAARARSAKPSARASELLGRFPWSEQLDFVVGLEFGSDRPVPEHENGFIALGERRRPTALNESCTNSYLFGLHEIVGWQGSVQRKKTLAFRARAAKDPVPAMEKALAPVEALSVYLQGALPEVPLLAIPELTHRIHSRLAERRSAGGKPAPMDEMLAFLDARWNAFTFQAPGTKGRTAVALPVFQLISDRQAFPYGFEIGEHLGGVGDIPFVSDPSLRHYAQVFRREEIEVREFIADSERAAAARAAFWQDCVYLARYRALVETFARAILAPDQPFPAFMEAFDHVGGAAPASREQARTLDAPRKHALVLWAFAGKDPSALADFVHENVLDLELNHFPKNAALASEFAYAVRNRDRELLSRIVERVTSAAGGDFACEFSPHETLLDPTSQAATGYLVHSFQAFQAPVATAIRAAAFAVVRAELGQ